MKSIDTGAAAILAAAIALATACDGERISVTVDESIVQQEVERKFPLERDLNLAVLTMTSPRVDLSSGSDRVGLSVDLELRRSGGALAIKGKGKVSGPLRYSREDATFYLQEPRIEQLELPLKLMRAERREKLLDTAGAALGEALGDVPLYTLRDTSRDRAAKALLRQARVKDGKLVLELGVGD